MRGNEHVQLQGDIDKLIDWSHRWQIDIDIDQPKVLHIDSKSKETRYSTNSVTMHNANEEKHLVVIISDDLKVSKECVEAAENAKKIFYAGECGRFKFLVKIMQLVYVCCQV